jgi:hypothetical protein
MVSNTIKAVEQVNLMYKACSYSAHPEFLMDPSKIIKTPFPIPCAGRWGSYGFGLTYNYSINGCGGLEAMSIVEAATINATLDSKFIYYMNIPFYPKDYSRCYWSGGSSTINYAGIAKQYIGTLKIGDASSLIHENGHMFTLMHSVATTSSNDGSSPMGYGGPTTCYNAPESSILGWSTSLATLTVVPDNQWREFAMPIFSTTPINHIIIDLQQKTTNHRLFLSLRSKDGNTLVDQTLNDIYEKKITVHSYARAKNSTFRFNIGMRMNPSLVYVITTIPTGAIFDFNNQGTWMQNPSTAPYFSLPQPAKIAIKHTSYSNKGSTIAICFYTVSAAECGSVCRC